MVTMRTRATSAIAALLVLALTACSKPAAPPKPEEDGPPLESAKPATEPGRPATEPPAATTAPKTPEKGVAVDSDDGERFGYVRKVWKAGDVVYLTVDYAEMLTGDDAAKEAAERGEESPPPNDYLIVNDNTRLRTFVVGADADVKYLVGGEPEPKPLSGGDDFLAKWDSAGSGDAIRVLPYELSVSGDTVTKLEQVFLP